MVEETVHATFDVYRYEPGKDAAPRYDRYVLDLTPHTPVLTALLKIRAELDPSLSLRVLLPQRDLRVVCDADQLEEPPRLRVPDRARARARRPYRHRADAQPARPP